MNLKIYTTAFLACLTIIACADAQTTDWNPFPENQVSLWSLADGRSEVYYNDFRVPMNTPRTAIGMGHTYYNTPSLGNCLNTVYTIRVPQQSNVVLPSTMRNEMMFAWDAGHWTFEEQNKELFFYPLANVGDTWGFNTLQSTGGYDSIQITCMQKQAGIVFGQPDSLKIFAVQPYLAGNLVGQTWTFKLSKQFGFIQFFPFKEILLGNPLEYWRLRGADPVGPDRFGFTSHFMDYFGDFSVGDVYKRKLEGYTQNSQTTPQYTRYTRDSVVNVVYASNSLAVSVTYARSEQSITRQIANNSWIYSPITTRLVSQVYDENTVGEFFQRPDSSYFINNYAVGRRLQWSLINTRTSGTLYGTLCADSTLSTSTTSYEATQGVCAFNYVYYLSGGSNYAPNLGLVSVSSFSSAGEYTLERMIGYRKSNGLYCDDYAPLTPLGIENSEKTSLRLLNTIANETLWVENKTSQNFSYRLVDIMGIVLQVGTSSDEAFALSVGHLAAGMYFLQLESDGQRTVQKFSVVR